MFYSILPVCFTSCLLSMFGPASGATILYRIFHTNNLYSQFEPQMYGKRSIGGFSRMVTYLKKNWEEHSVYVDTGDLFGGSDFFTVSKGAIWKDMWDGPLARFQKARIIGENELIYGIQPLLNYLGTSNTNYTVCANCKSTHPELKGKFADHHYLDYGIGITGVVCNHEEIALVQDLVTFSDPLETLLQIEKKYDSRMLFVLSHCGYSTDLYLARNIKRAAVIVGGHDGAYLCKNSTGCEIVVDKPAGIYPTEIINHSKHMVVIVQANQYARYLGHLRLELKQWKLYLGFASGPPVLMTDQWEKDKEVEDILDKYRPEVEELMNSVVGKSYVVLNGYDGICSIRECNLGNLITDAMAYKIGNLTGDKNPWSVSGIAFINGGAIADGITTPDRSHVIRYRDLKRVIPHNNHIYILKVTGTMLREALEHSISDMFANGSNRRPQFLQVSGIRVIYNLKHPVGSRVIVAQARCQFCREVRYEEIIYRKTYFVITTDYLTNKGDGYKMFDRRKVQTQFYKRQRLDLLETVKDFTIREEFVEPVVQERIIIMHQEDVPGGSSEISQFSVLYLLVIFVLVVLVAL